LLNSLALAFPYPRELPAELRARLATATPVTRKYLRGLYSGGTLASEALYLLDNPDNDRYQHPLLKAYHRLNSVLTLGESIPADIPNKQHQHRICRKADILWFAHTKNKPKFFLALR